MLPFLIGGMLMLYAAYGSNMDLEQMSIRCKTATFVDIAWINDWKLVFKSHTLGRCAYATVKPSKGYCVPIVLFDITKDDEKALDKYEGVAKGLYYKEQLTVQKQDKLVTAMLYIMRQEADYATPTIEYYDQLVGAYDHFSFPIEILREALHFSMERDF